MNETLGVSCLFRVNQGVMTAGLIAQHGSYKWGGGEVCGAKICFLFCGNHVITSSKELEFKS